jgi:hypothetical protein
MGRCMCSHKCLEHGIKNLMDVMTRPGATCCANECDLGSTWWEGQLDVHRAGFLEHA